MIASAVKNKSSKTAQEPGATSAATGGEPANSPRRIGSSQSEPSVLVPPAGGPIGLATPLKPFQGNVEAFVGAENKGERSPVSAQDGPASSCLVTGSSEHWSPEIGIDKFRFSHCREWRLTNNEFVAPKWTLSPAVAPGTFQKYTFPYPGTT